MFIDFFFWESSREEWKEKHTAVYSTYQQSGNPTGSGIRRLTIHHDECELTSISQGSPVFAENLDGFSTGKDLILQDGNVEDMERWRNVL